MSMFEILNDMIDNGVQQQSNNFIRASVISPPPELKIKFDNVEIPSEQIYCSNFLLPHYHRTYKIDGVIDEITINATTQTAIGNGPASHTHDHSTIKGSGTYKSSKDIWFEDTLKVGDEVLVLVLGINYVVVSKIVKMPSGAIEGV